MWELTLQTATDCVLESANSAFQQLATIVSHKFVE